MSAPLPQFLREIGMLLLEHRGQGVFALLSPAPPWFTELWGEVPAGHAGFPIGEKSPFLENFLYEADTFWNSGSAGVCQSETWMEKAPSGEEIPLQAAALLLGGNRYLALQSPKSQFRERVQLLQTARDASLEHEKLQREIQKKEILLHCIIHDLSQPLSVMSVALDCMADERVSDRGKEFLELGRKASGQQSSMIREVLQAFSSDLKTLLESEGKTESSPDLLACAQSVLKTFTPVYAAKNVQLLLDERTDQQADWRVRGEATRMERIFSNLLENALRYTPRGSRVTIGLERDSGFVKAFVEDEGPGLPADLAPAQIFALFSKGKEGGGKAGLGLYFCRVTVERWGGTIGCASLPEKGSRFWFRLPQSLPARGIPQGRYETPPPGPSVKPLSVKSYPMRILLADDQKDIRMLTTHQLERDGHHVVAVANGQEALDALEREPFDVVLMDEEMPVMNGLQAVRAMREREKERGPMVLVALTGYNTDTDRDRLLHAGFDSVIGKPFRLDALDALLKGPARSASLGKEHEAPAASPATPASQLLDRVGGDEKLARKMIATFLRDTPQRMEAIEKAVNKNDGEALAALAHALKGSVSIFGAQSARHYSQQLQELGRSKDFPGVARIYEQLKEEIAKLEANLRGYAGQRSSPKGGAKQKPKRRISGPKRKAP